MEAAMRRVPCILENTSCTFPRKQLTTLPLTVFQLLWKGSRTFSVEVAFAFVFRANTFYFPSMEVKNDRFHLEVEVTKGNGIFTYMEWHIKCPGMCGRLIVCLARVSAEISSGGMGTSSVSVCMFHFSHLLWSGQKLGETIELA